MTASRVSALALAAALAAALADPAGAAPPETETEGPRRVAPESPPPVRLVPPRKAPVPETPREIGPSPHHVPAPPPARHDLGRGREGAPMIEIDRLEAVDPDSFGILSETEGGLGLDMWQGASRGTVEALLPLLPAKSRSPVMRDLMRRLLLSVARVPSGEGAGASLVALRAERLAAMGEVDGVQSFLEAAPASLADEGMWRARVDALLLDGQEARACDHVRELIREHQDPYWQKAFVFCQIRDGETDKARLGTALLREQTAGEDAAFFALAGALLGESEDTLESMPDPAALHLAMMRAAGRPLPADSVSTTHLAVLRAIARDPATDIDVRLEAAERAEAAGVLSPRALSDVYASVSLSDEELAAALEAGGGDPGPRGRAALHQAARDHTVPTARAEVLRTAFESARGTGHFGTTVRVNLPLLLEIAPSADLAWFAADAGRALFYAGRLDDAYGWYDMAERQAPYSPVAETATARLWPFAQLTDSEDIFRWNADMVAAWRELQEDEVERRERTAVMLGLLHALGEPVSTALWRPLFDEETRVSLSMPSPALWHGLEAAADDLRTGETVLFALLALGEAGPGAANPIVLNRVVYSLRFIGLDAEARRLAVEAAVAAGL